MFKFPNFFYGSPMLDDHRGAFDPAFDLARLSRQGLAVLGREYMMAAHLQDRIALPYVLGRFGSDAMREVAIEEWMGASPIYTRRVQRALGFSGDDVGTIFKGIQLDVGAPHHFLDFRFTVHDDRHGEFRLAHCGALMDVEPMGEEHVRGMCHTIEDPTFDATAVATNPRARVRPVHRPPRVPAGRTPHCHWTVTIDPEAEPVTPIPLTARVGASRLARAEIPRPAAGEPGGWVDYDRPLDPDFELEDLAHPTLVVALQESCLQGHLLARALWLSLVERGGDEVARTVAASQWAGSAWIATERIRKAMGIDGDDLAAIAKLLQLHPTFVPRAYVDFHVELADDAVHCWIAPCDALAEEEPAGWFALLGDGEPHRALTTMLHPLNPRARAVSWQRPGAAYAWRVVIDERAEPAPEPEEAALAKLSTGATFVFTPRRPVRR